MGDIGRYREIEAPKGADSEKSCVSKGPRQNLFTFSSKSRPAKGPDGECTCIFDGLRQNLCTFMSKSRPQRVQILKTHMFLRVPGRIYAYLRANLGPEGSR